MQQKSFITPVWILGILVIVRIGFLSASMITYFKYLQSRKLDSSFWMVFLISAGVELLLLIGQAITYWVLRKKKSRRNFAWAHMAVYVFIFLVMPTLIYLLPFLLNNFYSGDSSIVMQKISTGYRYLFLTFFFAGLVLFIAFIVSTRKPNLDIDIEASTTNDILSDI